MVRENKASKFDFKNSNCEGKKRLRKNLVCPCSVFLTLAKMIRSYIFVKQEYSGGSAAPFGALAPTSPRQSPFFTRVKYNGFILYMEDVPLK